MKDPRQLTRNQQLVYDELCIAEGPVSAYNLLDKLRGYGVRAPLQIYRALEKLIQIGLVHKLESISSFVACQHLDEHIHQEAAFVICDKCKHVDELSSKKLGRQLRRLAIGTNIMINKTVIEMRGVCYNCKNSA